MNKAKAHMWIDEMESGRWRKARNIIARGKKGRCAVGVLSEVAGVEVWNFSSDIIFPCASWLECSEEFLNRVGEINDETAGWGEVIEFILENLENEVYQA